ncbi:MAG: helix-turn-helix domain-containing protein [Eubacterium sp.]|nr:helix-turn-helix domain-containing protein [Eubacterium sp.]
MKKSDTQEILNLSEDINTIDQGNYPDKYPVHWHNHIEILLGYGEGDGHNQINIHGTSYSLNKGDLLFIWPGDLHEIVANPNKEIIALQVYPGLITEQKDFSSRYNHMKDIHYISHNMSDTSEHCSRMISYIMEIFNYARVGNEFSSIYKTISLFNFFISFSRLLKNNYWSMPTQTNNFSKQTIDAINDAVRYIADNCERDISLNEVADYCGFSPSYFSKTFKKVTNYKYIDYLNLQRVKLAGQLLADFDNSITDIAFSSGFKSLSSFNRVFRELKGCTPRDYRKLHTMSYDLRE